MVQKDKRDNYFPSFNFFNKEFSNLLSIGDFSGIMSSSFKLMEEASEISKDFMTKGLGQSNLFSFFNNSAEIMSSSYIGYLEMMGFISKETYEELIKKYNEIQKELENQKKQVSQKETKIKDQGKQIKALEKDIKDLTAKIKELEEELKKKEAQKPATTKA